MATAKRKRLSLVEKYKAITELESGTKLSKVTEKYGDYRLIKMGHFF